MKTSILQSMLAKNKSVISDLVDSLRKEKDLLSHYNQGMSKLVLVNDITYGASFQIGVYSTSIKTIKWRMIELKKSLAQYAIIQKAIKDEIKKNNSRQMWSNDDN